MSEDVICPYKGNCTKEGHSCETCANNTGSKVDHYKPINPVIPIQYHYHPNVDNPWRPRIKPCNPYPTRPYNPWRHLVRGPMRCSV